MKDLIEEPDRKRERPNDRKRERRSIKLNGIYREYVSSWGIATLCPTLTNVPTNTPCVCVCVCGKHGKKKENNSK